MCRVEGTCRGPVARNKDEKRTDARNRECQHDRRTRPQEGGGGETNRAPRTAKTSRTAKTREGGGATNRTPRTAKTNRTSKSREGGGETNRTPRTAKTSRTANTREGGEERRTGPHGPQRRAGPQELGRGGRDEQGPADRRDEPDRKN